MKILALSNYYPPLEIGGWEQLTRDVCDGLIHRGHSVQVLTSNHRAKELKKDKLGVVRKLHLESPDHIHYHPHYILFRHWWERYNIRLLNKLVRDFNPDIIFVNGMWNLPISVAWEAERLCRERVIYYIASYWPSEPDAHTAYWKNGAASKWRNIPKRIVGTLVSRLLIPVMPRSQLDFTLVLCVSKFMRRVLENQSGIPGERIRVVHNAIKVEEFEYREKADGPDLLGLVYAGRLTPDKGVHTSIESLSYLKTERPNLNLRLTIVGGGTPEYESFLRKLVDEHELRDKVDFIGWVHRDRMSGILAKNDVFLFTSIWPEPLARAVQEAMACGLVVIGTTTGGTPEILKDGVNGITFEAGNASMLAERIAEIATNRERMVVMGKAARKTVEAHFSLERMVCELEANFYEVLQERR